MTWDENLLEFQEKYGGTLLGSPDPGCLSGLLYTRYEGTEVTLSATFRTFVRDWTLVLCASAAVELERPYRLLAKHRNKLVPQGLLADLEPCSTGREELDRALYVESDDGEFTKKVFLSPTLSTLLPREKRYQLRIAPVADSQTLHVVQARTDRLVCGEDGQMMASFPLKPLEDGRALPVLEHLAALAAAGADAVTRWRM
jgi:hypothetical protein